MPEAPNNVWGGKTLLRTSQGRATMYFLWLRLQIYSCTQILSECGLTIIAKSRDHLPPTLSPLHCPLLEVLADLQLTITPLRDGRYVIGTNLHRDCARVLLWPRSAHQALPLLCIQLSGQLLHKQKQRSTPLRGLAVC